MNKNTKSILFWICLIGALFLITNPFQGKFASSKPREFIYSTFVKAINNGEIKSVYLNRASNIVTGFQTNNKPFTVLVPDTDIRLTERLLINNVDITVTDTPGWQSLMANLVHLFPILFMIGIMIYSMRLNSSSKSGLGGGAMGFGKSRAKMFKQQKAQITFKDVAGIDEAKQDLEEVVEFLKAPDKFQRLGGRIPRGVLLVGDPGNGKTLLARAVAGEAGVPFFSISGSDFVEVFVGVGASRVREMFDNAKKNAPCIIFIDEIDAVGRRRDSSAFRGGNDEREQTLNQLLVEMDGFETNQSIIVIAATNRDDILDKALLRPGRFDRKIDVPYPDMIGREKILEVHSKNVPLASDVDLKTVARGTPGFSGAELASLVNEAALFAARKNKLSVNLSDFELAKDKVLMGSEHRTLGMSELEKKMTAYHEAGHALIALLSPRSDPIHKATIVPRGKALGVVIRLPENDKVSVSRAELLTDIKVAMGGRAAESIYFGEENVTTGASNDIEKASKIAKNMITKWGMSDQLGFQSFFLSQYYNDGMDKISQKTFEIIDKEVTELLDRLYKEVTDTMKSHSEQMHRIATKLFEKETLSGEELKQLLNGTYVEQETDSTINEYSLGGIPNADSTNDNNTSINNTSINNLKSTNSTNSTDSTSTDNKTNK